MSETVKYHVNPETGKTGICDAYKRPCKFGIPSNEHFATEEEARADFEKRNSSLTLVTHSKKKTVQEDLPQKVINIPSYCKEEMLSRIDKANKRLARNGIAERFEVEIKDYEKRISTGHGVYKTLNYSRLTFNYPQISYNGFKFLARVEDNEGNIIAYSAPGVEMNGWRPETIVCEHCNKPRKRNKVYVVEDSEGNKKVVGASCIELYTGLKPSLLSVMEWNPQNEYNDITDDFDDEDIKLNNSAYTSVDTNYALAQAKAIVDKYGYIKSSYDYSDKPSTKTMLRMLLGINSMTESNKVEETYADFSKQSISQAAEKIDAEKLKTTILEELKNDNNDWATNVKNLLNSDYVAEKHFGTLVSAITVIEKKKNREEYTPGFLGKVDEKFQDVKAEVISIKKDISDYGYTPQPYYRMELRTADGHKVSWSTTSAKIPSQGDKIIMRGKIQKTDKWNNVDTTKVGYVKWEKDNES